MQNIVALCDYQNKIGAKYFAKPYRSGMDKGLLTEAFRSFGFDLTCRKMSDLSLFDDLVGMPVIYTTQEDPGYRYKNYIEDIVYGLELNGCNVIPPYKYLRANNNKVFMEILRNEMLPIQYQTTSRLFGCFEELCDSLDNIEFPCVVKTAAGACSHGVHLANDQTELYKAAKKVSRSRDYSEELRDIGRRHNHKGYQKTSPYRNKFIVQDFIPGLNNDWKVLVYFDKFYVLRRKNRPGDFRASGSGLFTFDEHVDTDLLNAASEIYRYFDVPMISLDLAKSEDKVVLLEMQFVGFGTSTLEKSPYYYVKDDSEWKQVYQKSVLEEEYARSVTDYLRCKL